MRRRSALLFAFGSLLIWTLPAVSQAEALSPLDEINQVRASLGRAPLRLAEPDPIASEVLNLLADDYVDGTSGVPEDGQQFCGCLVGGDKDAQLVYREKGGTRLAAFGSYFAEDSPSTSRKFWPLLFDPRVEEVQVLSLDDFTALAVFADPDIPFNSPEFLYSGTSFDLHGNEPLMVLFPDAKRKYSLDRRRGNSWVARRQIIPAKSRLWIRGVGAAGMVNLASSLHESGERSVVGYSSIYRIGSKQFSTSPLPKLIYEQKFKFSSNLSRTEKMRISSTVRRAPAWVRRSVAQIDGLVFIGKHNESFSMAGGPRGGRDFSITYSADHLHANAFSKLAIMHEIGHIMDGLGLDQSSHKALTEQFSKSPKYKKCFHYPSPGSCLGENEIFADQFAFWSTGNRRVRSGYNVPPLSSDKSFGRLMNRYWSLSPLKFNFSLGDQSLEINPSGPINDEVSY